MQIIIFGFLIVSFVQVWSVQGDTRSISITSTILKEPSLDQLPGSRSLGRLGTPSLQSMTNAMNRRLERLGLRSSGSSSHSLQNGNLIGSLRTSSANSVSEEFHVGPNGILETDSAARSTSQRLGGSNHNLNFAGSNGFSIVNGRPIIASAFRFNK